MTIPGKKQSLYKQGVSFLALCQPLLLWFVAGQEKGMFQGFYHWKGSYTNSHTVIENIGRNGWSSYYLPFERCSSKKINSVYRLIHYILDLKAKLHAWVAGELFLAEEKQPRLYNRCSEQQQFSPGDQVPHPAQNDSISGKGLLSDKFTQ